MDIFSKAIQDLQLSTTTCDPAAQTLFAFLVAKAADDDAPAASGNYLTSALTAWDAVFGGDNVLYRKSRELLVVAADRKARGL